MTTTTTTTPCTTPCTTTPTCTTTRTQHTSTPPNAAPYHHTYHCIRERGPLGTHLHTPHRRLICPPPPYAPPILCGKRFGGIHTPPIQQLGCVGRVVVGIGIDAVCIAVVEGLVAYHVPILTKGDASANLWWGWVRGWREGDQGECCCYRGCYRGSC